MPSIKRNFIYRIMYEVLTIATPLITMPYVSRVLGVEGIGIYSYTLSCVSYVIMFSILGTNLYGIRAIANYRENKIKYSKVFWEIELITVITTSICILFWISVIFFTTNLKIYFLVLTPALLSSLFDISWFYTGHEKLGYALLINAIFKIFGVILIFFLIKEKDDLTVYILINSLIMLASNLSMWIFLPKFLVRVNIKTLKIWCHFKETLVYFIPTVAISIYAIFDKTLIGLITNDVVQNGCYEQASKILGIANTLSSYALNNVMLARMSFLFSEYKYKEAQAKIKTSMNLILFLSIGSMFGIIGIAEDFVPLFFGSGFTPVINLLYLMSPLIVIIGISNCLERQYYIPIGKTRKSTKIMIIGALVNLCLNLILIPIFEAKGAVIGSIGAETLIALLFVKFNNSYITFNYLLKKCIKKIFAAIIMLFTIKFLSYCKVFDGTPFILFEILIGICCYLFVLYVLKDSAILNLIKILSLYKKNFTKTV